MALRPKVFIVGISGLLGYSLALRLRKKFLVSGACFRNQIIIPDVQVFPVTLKSVEVLEAVLRVQQPNYVISAVGMNDRKEAEEQPKVSDMINTVLPVSMAVLSSRLKAKYIYLSCAEVFDGEKGNYAEEDTDFTLNDALGKQKITAHSYIRAQTLESTTLRIGRVLGVGHPYRYSFFDRIRTLASAKKPFEASKKKVRSYVSVNSLLSAVDKIISAEFPLKHRVFHVGGANLVEHDLVKTWYELMGVDAKIIGVLEDHKHNLSLDCKLMETQFPGWKAESKNQLLLNLFDELSPALGTKKWQRILQTP